MSRRFRSIGLAGHAIALVCAVIVYAPAEGAGRCTPANAPGRYGFLSTGQVLGSGGPQPFAAGGVLTLRSDGTFSMTGTQTINGTVTPVTPNAGTYVVLTDCTGSASSAGQPFFNFVIVGDRGDIEFIRTDLGTIVTGQAKRVAQDCTLANVRGSYGYAFNAIVFNIPIENMVLPVAFFAGGGMVSVDVGTDGQGRAVLDDTASFGGIVIPRHYEGTVSVNPDCTGFAVVTLPPNAPTSGNPVHVDAVWVNNRTGVFLIQTDPGTFIAGEAKRLPVALAISPPSGTYGSNQAFDLLLLLDAPGRTVTGGQATLDGVDVTGGLIGCVVPGSLPTGGQTFRCRNLIGAAFGAPGSHTLQVTVTLDDGSSHAQSVTYDIQQVIGP